MAFKPWTEIVNWAKTENIKTEDIVRYFWWDFAHSVCDYGPEKLLESLIAKDGKLGVPRSLMPHYINERFDRAPVEEYLDELMKDSIRNFVSGKYKQLGEVE